MSDLLNRLNEARSGSVVDRLLADAGIAEPKASRCGSCDFGSGTRGMDRCSTCDGTGSVFVVGPRIFPNTEEGYIDAAIAKVEAAKLVADHDAQRESFSRHNISTGDPRLD